MITIDNYQDKKSTIDWKAMPKNIIETRNDVEEIMEFYNDDADIKETVDLFFKGINSNLPKVEKVAVQKVSKSPLVIYKEGKFITKKTLQSEYSFTDNENLAYTWAESEKSVAEQIAKGYDGLVIDMKEANRITKLMEAAKANREKTYPAKPAVKSIYGFKNLGNGKFIIDNEKIDISNDVFEEKHPILILDTKSRQFETSLREYLKNGKRIYANEEKPKAPAKSKIKPIIDKKFVDNFSTEFQLIRRFWNIIKDEHITVPFRKTQLLFMAFNKAAIERKVRKTSEAADIFNQCNEKMRVLFEEFAKPTQSDVKVDFSDKKLFKEIEDYVNDVAINPAVSVLKRFIAIQNTTPDLKKAEAIKKSLEKVLTNDSNSRLSNELKDAIKWMNDYIKKPSTPVETEIYGLSATSVCKNRIKCAGIDKSGKLHKGYKFQEHTGNVVKVRKSKLGSPNVCENRVKCTGLSKTGKLLPGYKFQEGTNHVVKVRKTTKKPIKKNTVKKKVAVGLGFSDNLQFNEVERIYVDNPIIPILNQNLEIQEDEIKQEPKIIATLSQPAKSTVKNKLMQMQFDSLDLDQGWEKFMQNPAKNMKVAIWGKPKNGKTAGSLQMADYFSKFGKVLYNFADQGFNKSTQDLWKMSGLANNANAEPSDVSTLDALEKEVATGKYTFVFIDMISDYINKENIKPYEFKERFMKKYPKVSFILIFEVTKGGDFKGDQGWTHIVDAIVTVEDFLMENRGRYGVGSHIVWEEGFKKFNPKRYEEVKAELEPEPELEFTEVERI